MAYDASHGPPALDATHTWAPVTGTPPPVIGDSHEEPRAYPEVILDRITGWRTLPEIADRRAPRTFGEGEIPYQPRVLGKTLVYEARVVARTRLDLLATQNALIQGFGDRAGTGTMTVTPWAGIGGVVWTFTARVLDLAFDPAWTINDDGLTYEWAFTLTLRMADPRFYTGGTGYL